MLIAEKLKKILENRGWTVYRLAQETDLTDKSIYRWLRGESQPTVKALMEVCDALGMTMAEFFSEGNLIEVDKELKELHYYWTRLSKSEQAALKALIKNRSKTGAKF